MLSKFTFIPNFFFSLMSSTIDLALLIQKIIYILNNICNCQYTIPVMVYISEIGKTYNLWKRLE